MATKKKTKTKSVYIVSGGLVPYKIFCNEKDALDACGLDDPDDIASVDEEGVFVGENCTRIHIDAATTKSICTLSERGQRRGILCH